MRSYVDVGRIPTLQDALANLTVGGLRKLGGLFSASPLRLLFFAQGVMPDDLRARLRAFVPEPVPIAIESQPDLPKAVDIPFGTRPRESYWQPAHPKKVPLTVCERERAAPRELEALLRLVDAGRVTVSDKTRRPTESASREVAAVLEGGDYYAGSGTPSRKEPWPIRAFAWPLLLQASGLAEPAGAKLRLSVAGRRALGVPGAQTLRQLWERWAKSTLLDELQRIEVIRGQTGNGRRGLTAVAGRRTAVAQALAECPVGRWMQTEELFRFMRASGIDFEVTRSPWSLYIAEKQYGSLGYEGFGGWNILQARYALCVLFEYMATLGMVDVACVSPVGARNDFHDLWGTDELEFFSRYDGLAFVRLTPLGAYCLGRSAKVESVEAESVEADSGRVLEIRSDLTIAAAGPVPVADRLFLDRIARPAGRDCWQLDRARLIAVLVDGAEVREIGDFLASRATSGLPSEAEELLRELEAGARSLKDAGLARLVECVHPDLAAYLAAHPRTRDLCLRAGTHHVAVPAAKEKAFARALRQMGLVWPASP
jgi:hypothetical protein